MADFFNVSDSDESIDEVIQRDDQVERNTAQIDPKWFEITDDEAAEEQRVVLSRREKSLNEIQTNADVFDFNVDQGTWVGAEQSFKELREKSDIHKRRFQSTPFPFLECLRNTPDLKTHLSERESFAKPEEFRSLKGLIKAVEEAMETYKDDIERLYDEEDGDEGDEEEAEKELTEDDIVKQLRESVTCTGKKASKYRKLANECKRKGYKALQITTCGIVADALLEEDNREVYVSTKTWAKSCDTLEECFGLIVENPGIRLSDKFSDKLNKRDAFIKGGLHALLQSLSKHLRRITQFKDGIPSDYIEIVHLENRLVAIADALFGYYRDNSRGRAVCCQILVDILGSRRQEAHEILFGKMPPGQREAVSDSVIETVRSLYEQLLLIGDDESKSLALLHLVYQMGLEGKYREGRDLIRRSGGAEKLCNSNHNSVLYNRAVAQLGLASFIMGDIMQAYELLSPLWNSWEGPEVLIGQKLPNLKDEKGDEELRYRDLLLPPHAHIPYSQLELATMLSTLVVGTVDEAKKPYEVTHHHRYFYRVINQMQFQPLLGEPIEFREQITAAYTALKLGDYARSSEVIKNMKVWDNMPRGTEARDTFLQRLKEAALQIFCYNSRRSFATISVEIMAKKFDITESTVKHVINGIISENNTPLIAVWDRDDQYLHVDRSNISRLQYLVEATARSVENIAHYCEKGGHGNDFRGGRGQGYMRGGRGFGRGGGSDFRGAADYGRGRGRGRARGGQ
ncbi:eukaryotic translation initiation factor 3 subunit 8, putative [Trypanosoma equiperdum]|uniref:Eukaryotic translation initiation factor 3 subunit 8, putative n=2 Tax=Trypanozoon TaxID=39700 RepID=Q38AD5_TRYB2|nr:eukaryotic translation initiation factor 3 subunit 8, putative [Trypanosoma brucei brucei TREU927]XP_823063.1 eukaryotic translation initiation factor 3 subunit 8, putative [Trypanosoma brucei brucei TREU927]EAN78233.1 eukaryotic translation initiation factor 3 subunit 8, putative [Trypanosoma brucei brucei TREU927]EAN78235.1 eukaryotic translation initiation factor 3 subunit 8, putative [Trypanosoma brucei brucei TREU927]SCU70111.1 eukaryotic translation initiation factor 3 subunit 8, putat